METKPNQPRNQQRLLTDFIRQVGECSDTPSLIMLMAADADYLRLCRSIVAPGAEPNAQFAGALVSFCRDCGMNLNRLKIKLTPAARALGIVPSSDAAVDYYRLLGVRSQADAQEIKKAFRRKAGRVHPDANANLNGGTRQFVELNDAYRTLNDPVLRHHYDISRQHLLRWRERPTRSFPADERPTILSWYLGGLVFIFILLLLFLNIIV
ncbi:J domain-containing protein [Desulfosarcina sp.]|uniref:J domain-containing protein n=1 Tax=Desulfosarcina sp. TaxID=2027861 RepID=UPI003567C2A1